MEMISPRRILMKSQLIRKNNEELERLKRQEKEANDAAEALRKEFAQDTEDLLIQAGTARAISTNTVNTISPPNGTASTFSTGVPSYPDYDDSQ
ncbi:hypothetical protein Tco_0362427, partial [Tanacetum coccineum]